MMLLCSLRLMNFGFLRVATSRRFPWSGLPALLVSTCLAHRLNRRERIGRWHHATDQPIAKIPGGERGVFFRGFGAGGREDGTGGRHGGLALGFFIFVFLFFSNHAPLTEYVSEPPSINPAWSFSLLCIFLTFIPGFDFKASFRTPTQSTNNQLLLRDPWLTGVVDIWPAESITKPPRHGQDKTPPLSKRVESWTQGRGMAYLVMTRSSGDIAATPRQWPDARVDGRGPPIGRLGSPGWWLAMRGAHIEA